MLVRKQRKGTYVADIGVREDECPIHHVHIVVSPDFFKKEGLLADGQIIGIQGELPGAEITFNFPPAHDDSEFIQDLVHEALAARSTHAFVLVSSSLTSQRILSESGLPAVVGGSLHPSVSGLSWIDCDHVQEGQLLANHLLSRGCRKFLLLSRDRSMPGDDIFLESLRCELGAAGLGFGDVKQRRLPSDDRAIAAATAEMLRESEEKVGIVARSEPLELGAAHAVVDLKLKFGKNVELVVSNVHRIQPDNPPAFPYIRLTCDPRERGRHYGELIKRAVKRESPIGIRIPVELAVP